MAVHEHDTFPLKKGSKKRIQCGVEKTEKMKRISSHFWWFNSAELLLLYYFSIRTSWGSIFRYLFIILLLEQSNFLWIGKVFFLFWLGGVDVECAWEGEVSVKSQPNRMIGTILRCAGHCYQVIVMLPSPCKSPSLSHTREHVSPFMAPSLGRG